MESSKGITNPQGNLSLHLVGNLNTYWKCFLEKIIFKTELEFSLKDISKSELVKK
jgi:hypothetical protein